MSNLQETHTTRKPHFSESFSVLLRPMIDALEREFWRIGTAQPGAYPINSSQQSLIRSAHYALATLAELDEERA